MEMNVTNARIVLADTILDGTLIVRDGRIAELATGRSAAPGAIDLQGDLLIPGLVEIHTDHLERHLQPRPAVYWPSARAAVLAHDAQIAGAGITTVLDAIALGDYQEGGARRRMLFDAVDAIGAARTDGLFRADHLLHLRCELTDAAVVEIAERLIHDPLVRLVSVMDHTPGQRQWRDLNSYRLFLRSRGLTDAEFDDMVRTKQAHRERIVPAHRASILDMAHARRIPIASHDDTTIEDVDEAVGDGLTISEFPTTRAAAVQARAAGLAIVMGAPNVVRGGSHSGNVSALSLAEAGLLDGLSSDYAPVSLLHAAFVIAERVGLPLPRALQTVTRAPARMVGLTDRGEIAVGLRADLVQVRVADDLPIVRRVWRDGVQVS